MCESLLQCAIENVGANTVITPQSVEQVLASPMVGENYGQKLKSYGREKDNLTCEILLDELCYPDCSYIASILNNRTNV